MESTTQRALRCESIASKELESMPLAYFHNELCLALTSYYEGIIVKMEGASGVSKKLAYKRPIKRITDASLDILEPQPRANDAEVAPAAADPAAAAAPAEVAAAPDKPARGDGGEDDTVKPLTPLCLNLSVSCVRLVAAANSQLSGGPAGRMQQETNHWVKLYTGMSWYTFVKIVCFHIQKYRPISHDIMT
jgi:hypothetical protein